MISVAGKQEGLGWRHELFLLSSYFPCAKQPRTGGASLAKYHHQPVGPSPPHHKMVQLRVSSAVSSYPWQYPILYHSLHDRVPPAWCRFAEGASWGAAAVVRAIRVAVVARRVPALAGRVCSAVPVWGRSQDRLWPLYRLYQGKTAAWKRVVTAYDVALP